jgi:DNA-binding MarR family transcriptional regulator
MLIHLTDEGRNLIADYFPRHLNHIMEEFDVLNDEELEHLSCICKKLGLQEQE